VANLKTLNKLTISGVGPNHHGVWAGITFSRHFSALFDAANGLDMAILLLSMQTIAWCAPNGGMAREDRASGKRVRLAG